MSDPTPSRGRWGRISGGGGSRARRAETRILVVEDSPSARKLMQGILLKLGITLPELRLASDVEEAVRTFTDWRPEIVFLDVVLRPTAPAPTPAAGSTSGVSARDGVDLAAVFLARDPGVRVVVCSASDSSDPRIRDLLETPRTQFVLKPVVALRIREALDAAMAPLSNRGAAH